MFFKKILRYKREHGFKALLIKLRIHGCMLIKKWYERKFKQELLPHEALYKKFPNRKPFSYIKIDDKNYRLNLVVDALENHVSPLVLSILFANRHKIPLRIISRSAIAKPHKLIQFLNTHKIPKPFKLNCFSDWGKERRLELSDHDIFLATSKCTSESLKTLANPQLLFSDLYVNPCFAFIPKECRSKSRYQFLFYSQASFYTGLELIEKAFLEGIMNPTEWDLHFTGYQSLPIKFSNGLIPKFHATVCFSLLQDVDLFLCLDDPYKSFEIVSLGGVALTNESIGISANLIQIKNNSLQAFETAVNLAKNQQLRRQNLNRENNWESCFNEALTKMESHVFS